MRLPSLAASLFFVIHIAAITIAAVPAPSRLLEVTGERDSADDRLSRHVRPWLDRLVPLLERGNRLAWRATAPVRPVVDKYAQSFRLSQSWRMFAQPPRSNGYVAVCADYGPSDKERRCVVVNPQVPPDTFKGLLAYRPGFRDKAVSNAVDTYIELKARDPLVRPATDTRFGPDVLRPVGRYFGARLARPGEPRWVEVWHGAVAMPRRGERREARLDLPRWPDIDLPPGRRVDAVERAAGANWALLRAGPP